MKRFFTTFVAPLGALLLPLLVWAQTTKTTDYLLVENLPFIKDTTNIATYLQGVFNLGMGLAVTLAILMIVVNGIKYMVSDAIGEKIAAKDIIKNAMIGLLIIFGSVLILNTINPQLITFNLQATIDRTVAAIKAGQPGGADYEPPPSGDDEDEGTPWPSDSKERGMLGNNVTYNHGAVTCTTVGQEGCTSVYGLSPNTIAGIINLKTKCNCSLTITGATEYWAHKTHDDKQTVDFGLNPALATYIRGQDPTPQNTCLGPLYSFGGVEYLLENNNHWHVCYSGQCRFASGCKQ